MQPFGEDVDGCRKCSFLPLQFGVQTAAELCLASSLIELPYLG